MGSTTIEISMQIGAAENAPEIRDCLFPLEAEIVAGLHAVGVAAQGKADTEWTAAIKEHLGELARNNGLLQFPNTSEAEWEKGGEWLFDVVWVYARRGNDGLFDWRTCGGLALACESEWLTSEYSILEDFLKLTLVLADVRLFIYTNVVVDGVHPVDRCKRACPLSRGFRYLTIGFPRHQGLCRVDAWTA